MGFPDRIERAVELAHPRAKVWAALTTAEGLGSWFGNQATIDLRPGGLAQMTWTGGHTADALLAGRRSGMFCLVCYLRHGDRVFETYWNSGRGVEAMAPSYGLLDMTVHGRQETWEDSPAGWPQKVGSGYPLNRRSPGRTSPPTSLTCS